MIHIIFGTKAQLIKMAPLIRTLQQKEIPFNLIDLGQHSLITRDLRDEFGLNEPQIYVHSGENISSLKSAFLWLIKIFFQSLSSKKIKRKFFRNKDGICLIHGDTISTLIGLYLAKRAGLKAAHIESGLRSFCWLEPFPEEILRIVCMRFSDILFAPSQWAWDNLKKMGLDKKSILLSENTGKEALRLSLAKAPNSRQDDAQDFCLVTFHRAENILSRRRLLLILRFIKDAAFRMPVVFVRHPPTLRQIEKLCLTNELEGIKNIRYSRILSHNHFIGLLKACGLVMTDGGSIQEEAFYLGKPCLLLRRRTERNEGLGENAVLSGFEPDKNADFIINYRKFIREPRLASAEETASDLIIQNLIEYF